MGRDKERKLFYSNCWGGIYVEALGAHQIKLWNHLTEVTGNGFHEAEYQNLEKELNSRRRYKMKASKNK